MRCFALTREPHFVSDVRECGRDALVRDGGCPALASASPVDCSGSVIVCSSGPGSVTFSDGGWVAPKSLHIFCHDRSRSCIRRHATAPFAILTLPLAVFASVTADLRPALSVTSSSSALSSVWGGSMATAMLDLYVV